MYEIIIYYWPEAAIVNYARWHTHSVLWHVLVFFSKIPAPERERERELRKMRRSLKLGEREWNKLMYSDCRGRLQQGVIRFGAKCREKRASRMFFFSPRHPMWKIYTDMPARTSTWSSSHFYSRYIIVNSRLKYVWISGYPTDTPTLLSLLSILKDSSVWQYVQAACDTEGSSIILILCVCSFLEHSSDLSMKSTCTEPYMSL